MREENGEFQSLILEQREKKSALQQARIGSRGWLVCVNDQHPLAPSKWS